MVLLRYGSLFSEADHVRIVREARPFRQATVDRESDESDRNHDSDLEATGNLRYSDHCPTADIPKGSSWASDFQPHGGVAQLVKSSGFITRRSLVRIQSPLVPSAPDTGRLKPLTSDKSRGLRLIRIASSEGMIASESALFRPLR